MYTRKFYSILFSFLFAGLILFSTVPFSNALSLDSFVVNSGGEQSLSGSSLTMCLASIGDAIAGVFSSNSFEITAGFIPTTFLSCSLANNELVIYSDTTSKSFTSILDTAVYVSTDSTLSLTIPSGVSDPVLDFSNVLDTSGIPTVTISGTHTITALNTDVVVTTEITPGTTISSTGWDGIFTATTQKPTGSVSISGVDTTYVMEFGDPDRTLAFNPPIKLTFDGQAGKRAFITETGQGTGEVVTTCDSTDPSLVTLPTSFPQACKANSGNDLILLTGVASLFSFGTSSSTGGDSVYETPPSFSLTFAGDEYPISINNTKFTLDQLEFAVPTTIIETGKPIPVNLLIYDDNGPSDIFQVELYTNMHGAFGGVSNSDTSIIYKRGNPLEILDPNGFFSEVVFSSTEVNKKLQLAYEITFAKEMEKSDIIVQARDTGNNVGKLVVYDAWQVIQAPTVVETTETPIVVETTETPIVVETTETPIIEEPTVVFTPVESKITSVKTDKTSYVMAEGITVFGTVQGDESGEIVTIVIRDPNNKFLKLVSTHSDKNGNFQTKIDTDKKFISDGTYIATAFVGDVNKAISIQFDFSLVAPPVIFSVFEFKPQVEQSVESKLGPKTKPKEAIEQPSLAYTQKSELKTKIPSFPDPNKAPQHYIDRYNDEPIYKKWFDRQFPESTIEDVVSYEKTRLEGFPDPNKTPQYYIDRYNNESVYKEWFDRNFPNQTFEEIVGFPPSSKFKQESIPACGEGEKLVFKTKNNSPLCIRSEVADKLIARGWATSSI